MGADFISNCTATFTKGFEQGRADLMTVDLFTDLPVEQRRTFRAIPIGDAVFNTGETLLVRSTKDGVTIVQGRVNVAQFCGLPLNVADRIANQGGGIAAATVVKIHEHSGSLDISID